MDRISSFKEAHKKFIEGLKYITEHEAELKDDPKRLEKIKKNFFERFEAPLDLAWEALSVEERKSFATVYLARKAQTDPMVKNVLDAFGGTIIKIEEDENPAD